MGESRAVYVVRRLYGAVAEGDLEAAGGCFAAEAVWILPGSSAVAGVHRGWAAIHDDFLAKLRPLSGGTFRARLLDVCVGDQHVVAVQHVTAEHDGRTLDVTGCQLMRIQDGRIIEVRGPARSRRLLALDRTSGTGATRWG